MDKLFKALNDTTRREILELLRDKTLSAGDIANHFTISWPSISHHLDCLKQAGLVESSKEGQYVYYSINTEAVDNLIKWVVKLRNKKK